MKPLKSFAAIGLCIFLFACNQDKIDQLSEEKTELEGENLKKDSTIDNMLQTFNEIQENLNAIKEREGILQVSDPESQGQSMVSDIQTINELMQKNEALTKRLNQQLKASRNQSAQFRKLIENLNRQIELKNEEIAKLNVLLQKKDSKIADLYFSVDSLNYTVEQKEKSLEETKNDLYTAFYAYGTSKELREKNVLTKEGGILGIGKTESLKDNYNVDYFTKIDIRKQKSFLIYADKAELVTKHPKGSYKFMGDDQVDSLVITNPDEFWKASKMMVIVVD